LIVYSDEALDMREFRNYYERKDRIEAIISLNAAMLEAETSIDRSPESGLPSPRPYARLARPGRLWMKSRSYWVCYGIDRPHVIWAVFYAQANIPGRLKRG
jgi:hypothetical protein